ncbi:MAG: hypothetical protein CTY35_07510 [Methylotenera sp.]|nr:MAG: hypothetical protein CTY35_07510 [Methylotenera sp.]PPD49848.1 MAG: hypothetical protein CTY12_10305 [Methylotenera sp.]
MKLIKAGKLSAVISENNFINYPMSSFINLKSNVDTQSKELTALRVLQKFLDANKIDIATRCLEKNIFLTQHEARELRQLCWIPIDKIESYSNEFLKRIFKASSKAKSPEEMPGRIKRNSASQRTKTIARYLTHFNSYFVPQLLMSKVSLQAVSDNLEATNYILRNIRQADGNHEGQIISLPTSKFVDVIKTILEVPEEIFRTTLGTTSRNILRDQCIFLLACEGLRPGAIASIDMSQYDQTSGYLDMTKRSKNMDLSLKGPRSKGINSSLKNYSQPRLKVYPFTRALLQKYIHEERSEILSKFATNGSQGRLFINERGKPFSSSSTVKNVFSTAATALSKLQKLEIDDDPYVKTIKGKSNQYKFYAYVLRHSAATFFIAHNGLDDATLDAMKPRFGWSRNSKQPERYAARAYIDISNTILHGHMDELLNLANAIKER